MISSSRSYTNVALDHDRSSNESKEEYSIPLPPPSISVSLAPYTQSERIDQLVFQCQQVDVDWHEGAFTYNPSTLSVFFDSELYLILRYETHTYHMCIRMNEYLARESKSIEIPTSQGHTFYSIIHTLMSRNNDKRTEHLTEEWNEETIHARVLTIEVDLQPYHVQAHVSIVFFVDPYPLLHDIVIFKIYVTKIKSNK